jgi:autotransporter-associated beta strand protein
LGAGGDIFVQAGAFLTIDGGSLSGGSVTAGLGANGGTNGQAFGAGIFLQGNQNITFAPAAGMTETIGDVIADQSGSGGTEANAGVGSLTLNGAGTLVLNAANTLTGGVTIDAGTLSLGNSAGAGSGAITFATGANATLALASGVNPANAIDGFSAGDSIDFQGVAYATGDYATFAGNASATGGTVSVNNSSGATIASINVDGTYAPAQFVPSNDGTGHVLVTIPPSQTTYSNVSSASALSADIGIIDVESSGNGTNYVITLAAGQTLTEAADIDAVNLKGRDTLTINGQGAVLNGADAYRGLFVYSGAVMIENLTIENAVAKGGAGAGEGGGAGLGGGLFVADDSADGAAPASVTLSDVVFASDSAIGGAGGSGTTGGGGGGILDGGVLIPGVQAGNGRFGGIGGFGGGGGAGGIGGFGGGGGAADSVFTPDPGGFGGGDGWMDSHLLGPVIYYTSGGGGGLGAGGDIFVQAGASLTVDGGSLSGGSVTAGLGASGGTNGQAYGTGIFLQGNQNITFAPAVGITETISDVIADQSGSGGTGANAGAGSLTLNGAGTLSLNAANTFTGGVTIDAGTLSLGNTSGAGSGAITFATGANATLALASGVDPANVIEGYTGSQTIDFTALAYKSSYKEVFYATTTGGTLQIIDTANANAVVASSISSDPIRARLSVPRATAAQGPISALPRLRMRRQRRATFCSPVSPVAAILPTSRSIATGPIRASILSSRTSPISFTVPTPMTIRPAVTSSARSSTTPA